MGLICKLQVSAFVTKLNNSTSAKGKHWDGQGEDLRQWYNDQRTPCCLCGGSRPFLVLIGFCCEQKEQRMAGLT